MPKPRVDSTPPKQFGSLRHSSPGLPMRPPTDGSPQFRRRGRRSPATTAALRYVVPETAPDPRWPRRPNGRPRSPTPIGRGHPTPPTAVDKSVRYPPSRRPRPARHPRRRPARPGRQTADRVGAAHRAGHTSHVTPVVRNRVDRRTWRPVRFCQRRPPHATTPLPRGRPELPGAPATPVGPAARRVPASHPPRLAPILAARALSAVPQKQGDYPKNWVGCQRTLIRAGPRAYTHAANAFPGLMPVLTLASPAHGRAATAN